MRRRCGLILATIAVWLSGCASPLAPQPQPQHSRAVHRRRPHQVVPRTDEHASQTGDHPPRKGSVSAPRATSGDTSLRKIRTRSTTTPRPKQVTQIPATEHKTPTRKRSAELRGRVKPVRLAAVFPSSPPGAKAEAFKLHAPLSGAPAAHRAATPLRLPNILTANASPPPATTQPAKVEPTRDWSAATQPRSARAVAMILKTSQAPYAAIQIVGRPVQILGRIAAIKAAGAAGKSSVRVWLIATEDAPSVAALRKRKGLTMAAVARWDQQTRQAAARAKQDRLKRAKGAQRDIWQHVIKAIGANSQ